MKDYHNSEITILELEEKNRILTSQVKRLLQTEHELYDSQKQIDNQLNLYHDLFETARYISSCRDKNSILNKLVKFALYSLNIEKCIILKVVNGINLFNILALDGFYNENHISINSTIYLDDNLLSRVDCKSKSAFIFNTDTEKFNMINNNLNINTFVLFPICNENNNIEYIILAGNSLERAEFHSKIMENDLLLTAFGSLILQATDALTTISYLEELQQHRENLESQIKERTRELERSNSILLDEITERKKTENRLKNALNEIDTLEGIFPICSNCKSVRDDNGNWKNIEQYISKHSKAEFSHSLCPTCLKKLYPEYSDN